MSKKFLLAAVAALALVACQQPAPTAEAPAAAPVAVMPTQADVDAAYAKLDAALKAKDAAAIAAMYTPESVYVGPMENAVMKSDSAAVLAGVTEWLKTDPSQTTNSIEVQLLDADTFVASGLVTLDFKRNGRPTWLLQRFTDVWEKQSDGQWRIAASHASNAPKPVLARLPALAAAAAPGPDTPPLGGSAPAPVEEKK